MCDSAALRLEEITTGAVDLNELYERAAEPRNQRCELSPNHDVRAKAVQAFEATARV
jgi:hypothetical protein